ncbi:type II secretion system minor pseudopilin GspK [Catenovulum sediminis]|uniref:Type II secretion system protein K n=1 Tax=Catenovulum sediminis TaxID=1740262 RepID=A0ABV1RHQ1_9ALTE
MKKVKGVALITVLLIVALVTIIAAEMAVRLQMQIKRVDNIGANQQAYWFAIGGESLARLALTEAYQENSGRLDLSQPWAVEEMTYPLENGASLTGSIKDLRSCYNINAVTKVAARQNQQTSDGQNNNQNSSSNRTNNNADNNNSNSNNSNNNVLDPKSEEQFQHLLELAGIDNYEAEAIRDSVADWLDEDMQTRSYGAEDYIYEAKEFAYLPANSWFVDKSELKLIQGFDTVPEGAQNLDKILPHICVIPNVNDSIVNVNTIQEDNAVVLSALFNNKLTVENAKRVIEARPDDGFKDIEEFWALPEIKAVGNVSNHLKSQFDVTSEYFLLQTKTEYNQSWINLTSLIALDAQGKFSVIARKIGV